MWPRRLLRFQVFKSCREISSMNRNQWFVFAGVFFLLGIFLTSFASIWNVTCTGLLQPGSEMLYTACTIKSMSYAIPGMIILALGTAFSSCGYLEKKK